MKPLENNPKLEMRDPAELQAAPWNPNRVDPDDQMKLDNSVSRNGMFKPIICRELADGSLQILGGHYRRESALRLGLNQVPVFNLGPLDDDRAREITVIDNGRYGHDDAMALAELFDALGKPEELSSFMPYDLETLQAFQATASIDLDSLGLAEEDDAPVEAAPAKTAKTHEIMRFRVSLEDAERVRLILKAIIRDQELADPDELTRAGDALTWVLNDWAKRAD